MFGLESHNNMGIKNFISEFQDYFFVKRSLLESLDEDKLSSSNIEITLKQTEQIINDFKQELEFLDKETIEVYTEVEDIINSINSKIDKINFYAEAIKDINTTTEDKDNIISIFPYPLDTTSKNWEQNGRCYILEPKSSYINVSPYSTASYDSFAKKGVNKYIISDTFSTRYIALNKNATVKINNITCFNSAREELSTIVLNSENSNVITIPHNTVYINIEYEAEDSSSINFNIIPLSFYHFGTSIIPLQFNTYPYGNILSFNVKKDIPFGCYMQIKMYCTFKDINGNVITTEEFWYSIDNDNKIVLKKEWVTTEVIERVWKNGAFKNIESNAELDSIKNNDYVVCKPTYSSKIRLNTESSFFLDVKGAKTVEIQPSLYLYSLANETLTPRFNSLTGIMKSINLN